MELFCYAEKYKSIIDEEFRFSEVYCKSDRIYESLKSFREEEN